MVCLSSVLIFWFQDQKKVGYSDVPNDPFCVFQALEGALRTSDQEWY